MTAVSAWWTGLVGVVATTLAVVLGLTAWIAVALVWSVLLTSIEVERVRGRNAWRTGVAVAVAVAVALGVGYPAWVVVPLIWFVEFTAIGVARRDPTIERRKISALEVDNRYHCFGISCLIAWGWAQTRWSGVATASIVGIVWIIGVHWTRSRAALHEDSGDSSTRA